MLITSIENALYVVKRNGLDLQYVPKEFQTEEVCLEAVKESGLALFHIEDQTEEMCLIAVKSHGSLLRFVKHPTPKVTQAALLQYPDAFKYVKPCM